VIVWVNELKGLCRGSRRSSSQGLRLAGFRVMMVLLKFTEFLDFGGLVRASTHFFPTLV
jgi:hypothetical protein